MKKDSLSPRTVRRLWEEKPCRVDSLKALEASVRACRGKCNVPQPIIKKQFDRIVIVALGSPSKNLISAQQLAFALDVRDAIDVSLPTVLYEPFLTALDRELFEKKNVEVAEDVHFISEVTVAPHPNFGLRPRDLIMAFHPPRVVGLALFEQMRSKSVLLNNELYDEFVEKNEETKIKPIDIEMSSEIFCSMSWFIRR